MNYLNTLYPAFKKIAFYFDPEKIHELTIHFFKKIGPHLSNSTNQINFNVQAMGLKLSSPIGLAAGLDKNAEAIDFLTDLPFGFIEIGTVTPIAQAGNERPRLFRYPESESLRNKMGFNNLGSDQVISNIIKSNSRNKIIGANLGKNKLTPNENAHLDYALLYKKFAPYVDYLVINVSSPNTPGLRNLLSENGLKEIFESTSRERNKLAKPLFVKVSPDMEEDQLLSVIDLVKKYNLTGIIATNTTIIPNLGEGGISGKLLFEKARKTREFLLKELTDFPEIELIGVGGFSSFEDIKDFWIKGGKLVQIYSSFIFQGTSILFEFERLLEADFKKYKVETFDEYLHEIRKVIL